MKIQAFGMTDVGVVRGRNEDAILVDDTLGLYAVADGMGGHKGGEVASKMAGDMLLDYMKKVASGNGAFFGVPMPDVSTATNHLGAGIRFANQAIYEASLANPAWQRMGTTVAAVLLQGNRAGIAHVGDSRVYLLRNAELRQLTEDHSLINEQLKMGVITREQAEQSNRKNVITRALGQGDSLDVDLAEILLQDGDKLLICSDGLTGMVPDEKITGMLASVPSLELAAKSLVEMANHNGGKDNISVILVTITEEKGFVAGLKRMFLRD